jgi:tRNA modification GTPase
MIYANMDDTIAAIATPSGESGIGIVRLSGKDALSIMDKIFISKKGKKPSDSKTYTMHYGWIIDNKAKIVDEVILAIMRAPRSFTTEDVAEINCHGGSVMIGAILDIVIANGARLAQPGEFTRRAFLNGRIDLAQAEAVLDIIQARTESALKIGMQQLNGVLSGQINKVRDKLLEIQAVLEVNIDFPEEEIDCNLLEALKGKLKEAAVCLNGILDTAHQGKLMRDGIRVVICGCANVGKSSLLNAILKEERSIVTAISGTTRDTIEEVVDIKGIPVKIIDTAGILEPRDLVEKKAVLRSKRHIDSADLVLFLFDGSRKLSREDKYLIKKLNKRAVIAIINKMDLKQKIEKPVLMQKFPHLIEISAKRSKNIHLLEDMIWRLIYKGEVIAPESVIMSNSRHITALRHAQKLIAEAQDSLDNKLSLEFIAQDTKDALGYLDDILGLRFSPDLLNKIFADFCIGK